MGNENRIKNRKSNASVLEMSLDTKNPIHEDYSSDSDSDIKEELKQKIDLPIENEIYENEGILFGDNIDEIKNHIFSEGEAPPVSNPYIHGYRSKSYAPNPNIILFHAPKPQFKSFNEHITPFKLSTKTFGGSNWKNKKPNTTVSEFQKNILDSKSCNDNQNSDDEFFDEIVSDIDTERTTPNVEDMKNLQNCRKKMAIFRDSIDNKSELSTGESDKVEEFLSEKKNNKKNNFLIRHIKQQSKISNKLRLSTDFLKKKSETLKPQKIQKIQDNGLFILGVLESAAKEKKLKKQARYTSNV